MSFIDTPDFVETSKDRERDGAVPRFYEEAVQNMRRTEEDGCARFDQVEMVEIHIPGDRRTIHHSPVRDEHKRRWPGQYKAFKDGLEAPLDGDPLAEWPPLNKAQVQELASQGVKTVQQLANLTDSQLGRAVPMNGFALREKAQRWVESVSDHAPIERLAAENAQLRADNEAQKLQMADLAARMDGLVAQIAAQGQSQAPEPPKARTAKEPPNDVGKPERGGT